MSSASFPVRGNERARHRIRSAQAYVVARPACRVTQSREASAPDPVDPTAHVLLEPREFARVLLHRYRRAVLGVEVVDDKADWVQAERPGRLGVEAQLVLVLRERRAVLGGLDVHYFDRGRVRSCRP